MSEYDRIMNCVREFLPDTVTLSFDEVQKKFLFEFIDSETEITLTETFYFDSLVSVNDVWAGLFNFVLQEYNKAIHRVHQLTKE